MSPEPLYIVEVHDRCAPQLTGHIGSTYASPPQPVDQARALVALLLGRPALPVDPATSSWKAAIAGGQRHVSLHAAHADGQLHL
ncbi:MAG: hypothetical protein ACLP50_04580 [Solirubrobacteraceae bacterium]